MIQGVALAKTETASAEIERVGRGVLLITLSGPQTQRGLAALRLAIRARFGGETESFVVDYRNAVVLMTAQELSATIEATRTDMPAALLVNAAQLQVFVASAKLSAAVGIVRRVFLEDAEAIAWALRQAAIHRQDFRLPAQS